MSELAKRILENKNIELIYDKKVINFIAREVYNPEYGAREVKRFITDKIEDKIASNLIFWKISDRIVLQLNKKEIEIVS